MAGRPGKNPFDSDDEDDSFVDIDANKMSEVQRQKAYYQERMVDSSYRSLRVLEETQIVASETGRNLHRQGEQLNNVEKNLDKIEGDMKVADRNVTSIKSIWGALGNYFRKEPKPSEAESARQKSEDVGLEAEKLGYISSKVDYNGGASRHNDPSLKSSLQLQTSHQSDPNHIVDKNLDQMLGGLKSLKQNALLFGEEIDKQNVQIERINTKSDKANLKVEDTTSKIRKVL